MIQLKSRDEIEKIEAAGRLVMKVMHALRDQIRPGVSTAELDQLARTIINEAGGSAPTLGYGDPPYPAATCISIDDEIVHGIPAEDRVLETGNIVTFDVVCELGGWVADAARTYPVGEITEEKETLIEAAKTCFYDGLNQAVIGNRIGDISATVQNSAESKGYSVIRELTGHGIGRSMHEAPDVPNFGRAGRGPRLQEGMVICIEPMIAAGQRYVTLKADEWTVAMRDGRPSAHYENTVAVTKDGPEILTKE